MKDVLEKILSLTENYIKKAGLVAKKLPTFQDPQHSDPNKFFIVAEIVEEFSNMDKQLYEKFEYIVDICTAEITGIKNHINKTLAKILADGIHNLKRCKKASDRLKEQGIINLEQIMLPEFRIRKDSFDKQQLIEIDFCEETLQNYNRKIKELNKYYDQCLAKASKLYGMLNGTI